MRNRSRTAFILLVILAQATSLAPLVNAAGLDTPALGALRPEMQRFVDAGEVPGAVFAVGTKEGAAVLDVVGAQTPGGKPMARDALFRIASITKPITALGLAILAEEGKLSFEDPVERHLPEFRGQQLVKSRAGEEITLGKPSRPITIADLLSHTSGLPGSPPPGLRELYLKRDRTLAEAVLAFSQRPLDFEPGSRWSYCNTGIDTVGRVIEVLSGEPYEEFLEERLFAPLGMLDTTFYPTEEQMERAAALVERREGKLVPAPEGLIGPPDGARYPIPAGGLWSTASDLTRLCRMLLAGGELGGRRVLRPESIEALTRLRTGELACGFTPGMGFGLGFGVVRAPEGVTARLSPGTYGHGGAFGTQMWIDPRRGLFVVLLIQRTGLPNADASDLRRALQEIAVGAWRE